MTTATAPAPRRSLKRGQRPADQPAAPDAEVTTPSSPEPEPSPEPATTKVMKFVVCSGGKQEWAEVQAEGLALPARDRFQCDKCGQTARDLKTNINVRNDKPIPKLVPIHKVEKEVDEPVKATVTKTASRKADAKQTLARIVVDAVAVALRFDEDPSVDPEIGKLLAELGTTDDVRQVVAQWLHHLPTGKTAESQRYWPEGMPRPDRSDWK